MATESRKVDLFSAIELRGAADVYITQGEVQSLVIESEAAILPSIITSVINNELLIDIDEHQHSSKAVTVKITVRELCLLELTGSGSITSLTSLNCDLLTMRLSGSGEINANVISKGLKANLAGSGKLDIRGAADESDIRITGSGNVNAQNLQSLKSAVSISGEGSCKLNTIDELIVNISGIGNVYYVNEPAFIRSRITGTGDVLKI